MAAYIYLALIEVSFAVAKVLQIKDNAKNNHL